MLVGLRCKPNIPTPPEEEVRTFEITGFGGGTEQGTGRAKLDNEPRQTGPVGMASIVHIYVACRQTSS